MDATDAEIVENGDDMVSALTGEVASEDTQALAVRDPFVGISASPFTAEQSAALMKRVADEDVEIRPDGMVYLPQSRYRRTLNSIFGPGAWAIMPLHDPMVRDNTVVYHGALFIQGRFIAEAYGEGKYFETNGNTTFATAIESAKSDCLTRCAKDIGIANDLWDPTFVAAWKERNAVGVWCENSKDKKKKKFWRKKTAAPIDMWPWVETGGASKPRSDEGRDDWGQQFDRPATNTHAENRPVNASAPESPASPSSSVPPKSDYSEKRLISPRQAGRFHAITRVHDWKEREIQRLLADYRFSSVEEITRDEYEALCDALVDEGLRDKYRRQIEQEDSAGDVLEEILK